MEQKNIFLFSLKILSETFCILKIIERDIIINVNWFLCREPVIIDLMKLEFSHRFFFEKYSNIKFHENLSSVSRVVPCGRTDMTKLIVAFRYFVNAPNNFAEISPG